MADKIFTDNDLLEEKSYDTKIMEGAGVEPDATYLEQTPVKKRLAEAVSGGGGGSSGGDIVYVPVSVDMTDPDNPVVTCETSVDTILGYFAEGKLVYLKYTYNVANENYLLFSPTYVETVDKNIQWASIQPGTPFFITTIYTSGTEWGYAEFIMQLVQG